MGIINTIRPNHHSGFQAFFNVAVFGIILTLIIIAFLEHSWAIFIADIVMYFLLPGIGRALTLMAFRKWDAIDPLSYIVTFLFIIVLLYALTTGRVVTYV